MAEDKQVRKYWENLSYGKNSLSSEIHGKINQEYINKRVASAVRMYDQHMADGNKEMAAHFKSQIMKWSADLDNLKGIKEEYAMNESLFSNYTDQSFEKKFMTEQGRMMIDERLEFQLGVIDDEGKPIFKKIEDITENWVLKGTEESDFMRLQQSAVKQRNDMGEPLDFDVYWEVSKILEQSDAAKVLTSDKIGGIYFLNEYVEENEEAITSGEIPDHMLHPDSFDPSQDNRLLTFYSNRIFKAFDENYQTPAEARKADELIARTNTQDNTEETNTENTQV